MAVNFTKSDGGGSLPLIKSYGEGGFRIAGIRHEGTVLIVNGTVTSVPVTSVADLTVDHLGPVIAAEPRIDIFLIGSGLNLEMPPIAVRSALEAAKVAFDPMDTGAAARTYNVLLLEDRRVAVLLTATP